MEIVLFEPEIPQNTGAILRSASCFGFSVSLIEPLGFILSSSKLKRGGMDYLDDLNLKTYSSFEDFLDRKQEGRILLLSPEASKLHNTFDYRETDFLLMGKESSGVPEYVQNRSDEILRIPMLPQKRSLNLAVSASIVMCEAAYKIGQTQ